MKSTLSLSSFFGRAHFSRGLLFGLLILAALFAFEAFNYSTTEFALGDLLGDLTFASVRWATILALAFCGIDFAGIARLFTPQQGESEQKEVWYLFGAWLLAATMNAMLTWWGVSVAILNHDSLGGSVMARPTMLKVVPIFVAIMVWLIRILIIGSFSLAGDRLFSQGENRSYRRSRSSIAPASSLPRSALGTPSFRPTPKSIEPERPAVKRPEPSYHPASMSSSRSDNLTRR